jgi:cytochrome c-type biogenesis protein CcmF
VGTVSEGKRFALLSREGALVVNNLLLSVILATVLVGTLYPVAAEAMGDRISVGPPYFNATAGPLALLLIAAMALGPLLRWRQDSGAAVKRYAPWLLLALAAVIALVAFFAPGTSLLSMLGLALAAAVAVASLLPLRGRNLRRTPLPIWGMVVAHFGVAVALAGMATESAFIKERLSAVAPGDSVEVGDWRVTLTDVHPVVGPNWTALEGRVSVVRGGSAAVIMLPQARSFTQPPTETNEAALLTRWDGQLYVVLGQSAGRAEDGRERWQLRLWWKPLVWWIWAGGGLIALGGLLALIGRVNVRTLWRMKGRAA